MLSHDIQENIAHFEYATDISSYKRDADGVPVIDMSDDRSMTIALRFCEIFSKTNPEICFSEHTLSDSNLYDAFSEGRTLFLPERFYAAVTNYFYALLVRCILNDQPYASQIKSVNSAIRTLYENFYE